jgi:hypothetical protein
LSDLNDCVWITLSDFADLQSLGRLGSASEALAAKQLAVGRAVHVIENDEPGALHIASKLRCALAGRHADVGHVASLLSRPQWNVRVAVLEALRDARKDAGTPHLDAVVDLIEDPDAQVRLAALRALRVFAPRTSVFAARFAAVLDKTSADSQAQRNFIREAFVAMATFGFHAVPYGKLIRKARSKLIWSAEVEAACVAFAELGISFEPSLTASLKSKGDPSIVDYSVRHDRSLDKIRVCLPEGAFRGAEAYAFAIFEDLHGFMPHAPVHRDVSITWSAWRTTISAQTDSSFTLAEGRRSLFADRAGSLDEYTISCGGSDVSCTRFDGQKLPCRYETIVSMARVTVERLELYGRLCRGWSNHHTHVATCCGVLAELASDSDMQETRLALEGCSCVFCASVLQVFSSADASAQKAQGSEP